MKNVKKATDEVKTQSNNHLKYVEQAKENGMDRDTIITLAARQVFYVGYLDGVHQIQSPYMEILDEVGDFYHLDLTYQDDEVIRFHYRLGYNYALSHKQNGTIEYNYQDILKNLEETEIPHQTMMKILYTYPDFDMKHY